MPSHRESALAALEDSGYDRQLADSQSRRAMAPSPPPATKAVSGEEAKPSRLRRATKRMGHDFARAKNFVSHKLRR